MLLATLAVCSLVTPTPLQESVLPYDAGQVVLPPTEPLIRRLLHLDSDGIPDAVGLQTYFGVSSGDDRTNIGVYFGDGTGGFAKAWQLEIQGPWPSIENTMVAGDFDGDGLDDDFAIAVSSGLYAFQGDSRNVPTAWPEITLGTHGPVDLEVTDIDGDGKDDIVSATGNSVGGGMGSLNVHLSQQPWVAANAGTLALNYRPFAMALYRQGPNVFAALSHSTGSPQYEVRVHTYNVTSGTPQFVQTYVLPTQFGTWQDCALVGGDVDNDGDDDLVGFVNNKCYCLRSGNGSFVMEPGYLGGPATDLFDIDQDGDLDGVCCGGGSGPFTSKHTWSSEWEIALNDGTGEFARSYSIAGSAGQGWSGADDVDGDGDLDLVAGRTVYFDRGEHYAGYPKSVGVLGGSGAVVDADGDGDLDFSVAMQNGVLPTYYENDGSGQTSFTTFPTSGWPTPWVAPYTAAVGDFDGDGDPDCVMGFFLTQGVRTSFFVENVAGTMTYRSTPTTDALGYGVGYSRTLSIDWDRDGDLDVVHTPSSMVWPFNYALTTVYLNDGNADFVLSVTETALWIVEHVDLDGDGLKDFLVGVPSGLGWRKALATGGMGAFQALPAVCHPEGRVAVADFDEDGDLDLVSFMLDGETPLIFENDGAGNFVAHFNLIPVQDPASNGITMGWSQTDFDGDGKRDLILGTGPSGAATAKLFRNTGNGSLGFTFLAEQVLPSLTPFDIDLDGDEDLVGGLLHRAVRINAAQGGSAQQYGEGTPGSGGFVPRFGVGQSLDSGTFTRFKASAVKGGQYSILAFSLVPAELMNFPAIGVTAYLNPGFVTTIEFPMPGPAQDGAGAVTLPLYVPPGIGGATFYHQLFVIDPGAVGGIAASKALRLTCGTF